MMNATVFYGYLDTPIGLLEVCTNEDSLLAISFVSGRTHEVSDLTIIATTIQQLKEYFCGGRTTFDLKLQLEGTEFQNAVWQKLMDIPYGQTTSYGALAKAVGNPKASRAVGGANNKNKIPIVIPCHRVVGTKGAMVGYAGEIWRKESLLKLEKTI